MSRVLANTLNLYKKVFLLEITFLLLISLFVFYFFFAQFLAFVLGALTALLPQMGFVAYALFKQGNNKIGILYKSEGLKIILTIVLFSFILIWFKSSPLGLFSGYFLFVFFNSIIPMLLYRKHKIS